MSKENTTTILSGQIVTYTATQAYRAHILEIIQYVHDQLTKFNAVHNLIGNNPLSMMYDNHNNHADFMANVFGLNEYELLKVL